MQYARNPFLILPIIFLVTLAVYILCGAPTIMYGDSAELQAVALKGGVAHPSGYPTFVMLGQFFGRVLQGDPARRITIMSSIFGAAAVCAFFLVLLKFGVPVDPAFFGSIIYGAGFTFWWSATRTEVYTLAIFIFLIGLWLTLHALEKPTLARTGLAGAAMGLTLTGHLSFAPVILVIFVFLFLRSPPEGVSPPRYWSVLLLSFLAGLTPYLYLVWADHGGFPMNYLNYTIELGSGQFGLTEQTFNDPWERIPWLIFGKESRPLVFLFHLRPMLWQLLRVLAIEFLYHSGPIGLPLFIMGSYHLLKKSGKKAFVLFAIIAASALFGAGFGPGRMLQIFLLPATIGIAVAISFGIWFLIENFLGRKSRFRFAKSVMILVLICVTIVAPHLIRVRLDRSYSFPQSLKMQVEGEPKIESAVPALRDFWEPRTYGERVLDLLPENSFVTGKWKEIMVLYYLHYVEGKRPDIKLDPYYREHFIRFEQWQETHDITTHPFVFLSRLPGLTDELSGLDSLSVDDDRSLYICRRPLLGN
ncbi:MAG: DUF2723 domain-containing protein [Candidatus Krumholzibacteria bacterium]|nr:DUF2723 domain-containing protein [Candidatus Krumholzibacteria bacterium]